MISARSSWGIGYDIYRAEELQKKEPDTVTSLREMSRDMIVGVVMPATVESTGQLVAAFDTVVVSRLQYYGGRFDTPPHVAAAWALRAQIELDDGPLNWISINTQPAYSSTTQHYVLGHGDEDLIVFPTAMVNNSIDVNAVRHVMSQLPPSVEI